MSKERTYWKILGSAGVWIVLVFLASIVSDRLFKDSASRFTGVGLFSGTKAMTTTFLRWDAVHYFRLAYHGYLPSFPALKAFFPLYPLIIRAGAWVAKPWIPDALDSYLFVALVVNVSCLLGALCLIQRIGERLYGESMTKGFPAPLFMLLSPWAFFYLSPYPEVAMLLLSTAAFCAAIEKKWLWAGLLAGLASGSRLQGIFLFPALAVEYAHQKTWDWKKIRWDALGLLLCPAGFLAYMKYLGGVGVFLNAQEHWTVRKAGSSPWLAFSNYFDRAWRGVTLYGTPEALDERISYHASLLVLLIALFLIVSFWKKLRPSFKVYLLISLTIPILSSSVMAIQRYALVLFPLCYPAAYFFEKKKEIFWILVMACGYWSCFFIALFTNGYFVS